MAATNQINDRAKQLSANAVSSILNYNFHPSLSNDPSVGRPTSNMLDRTTPHNPSSPNIPNLLAPREDSLPVDGPLNSNELSTGQLPPAAVSAVNAVVESTTANNSNDKETNIAPVLVNSNLTTADKMSERTAFTSAIETTTFTLEPYTAPAERGNWTTINRRTKRRQFRERQMQKLMTLNEVFQPEQLHFDKYFLIRFPGVTINTDINFIETDRDLRRQVGCLKKITKAGKSIILVESSNAGQTEKLKQLKKLGNHFVVVEPHSKFNFSKGVVRSKSFKHNTEEELQEQLESQGVVSVQRMKMRREGEWQNSDTYVLTFNLSSCPKVIKIVDWHLEKVEEYKYRPQQCFKCQKFGHVSKYCRSEVEVCARCGRRGHPKAQCENDVSCFHCKHAHFSTDRTCPKYKCEESIIALQMREKITRLEALDRTLETNPEYENLYTPSLPNESSAPENTNGAHGGENITETTVERSNPSPASIVPTGNPSGGERNKISNIYNTVKTPPVQRKMPPNRQQNTFPSSAPAVNPTIAEASKKNSPKRNTSSSHRRLTTQPEVQNESGPKIVHTTDSSLKNPPNNNETKNMEISDGNSAPPKKNVPIINLIEVPKGLSDRPQTKRVVDYGSDSGDDIDSSLSTKKTTNETDATIRAKAFPPTQPGKKAKTENKKSPPKRISVIGNNVHNKKPDQSHSGARNITKFRY